MLTNEQLNILGVFKKNIFTSLTFKQIKEQSKQKSNNVTQIALEKFKTYDLINKEQIGDVSVYSLNLENNLTLSYLNLINEANIPKKLPLDILNEIQKKILKYTEFFILAIFGSHAKDKATEKSDLDVAIIAESEQTKKEITPYLETIKRREATKIDYHIFTKLEFLEMLKADYENLGKQIYKNSIIYYGYVNYIQLIRRKQNE